MKKLFWMVGLLLVSAPVFAQEGFVMTETSWKYLAYFLGVAAASVGGTRAQSAAASVALEGIARNPSAAGQLFTPMILGLALMESLVIFMLISVFLV